MKTKIVIPCQKGTVRLTAPLTVNAPEWINKITQNVVVPVFGIDCLFHASTPGYVVLIEELLGRVDSDRLRAWFAECVKSKSENFFIISLNDAKIVQPITLCP